MHGKNNELWMELCERTASEHDSKKLLNLVEEINILFEINKERLNRESAIIRQTTTSETARPAPLPSQE